MSNLTTRKIVLGLLMVLVLAFSVQGIADALTFGTTRTGDLQTASEQQEFRITFSVSLASNTTPITNDDGELVSDDRSTRIDGLGYPVFDAGDGNAYRTTSTTVGNLESGGGSAVTGDRPIYNNETPQATNENGTLYVNNSGQVVNADGEAVYIRTGTGTMFNDRGNNDPVDDVAADRYIYTRATANPNAKVADANRYHYQQERVTISLSGNDSARITKVGNVNIPSAASHVLMETGTGSEQLSSRNTTLTLSAMDAGETTITIADTTPPGDRTDAAPSITFTVYVVDDRDTGAAVAEWGFIGLTNNYKNGGTDFADEAITTADDAITTADDDPNDPNDAHVRVEYKIVSGSGRLYVQKVRDRVTYKGSAARTLSTSSAAEVRLDMGSSTNVVEALISGVAPTKGIFIFGFPNVAIVASSNNQEGVFNGRLDDPLVVKVTDGKGRAIPGLPARFSKVEESTGMFIPVPGTTVYTIGATGSELASTLTPFTTVATATRPGENDVIFVQTDSRGEARTYFRLAGSGEDQSVSVTAGGSTPITPQNFTFTAGSGTRRPILSILSGNNQRTNSDGDIEDPLVVVVRRDGNLQPGHKVTFRTSKGTILGYTEASVDSFISNSTPFDADSSDSGKRVYGVTDGSGEAEVTYYQDAGEGSDTVTATISGPDYEKTVTFNINGRGGSGPSEPSNAITITLSSTTGEPGEEIDVTVSSDPSAVVVLDSGDLDDDDFSRLFGTTPFDITIVLPDEEGEYDFSAEAPGYTSDSATVTVEAELGELSITAIGTPEAGLQTFSISAVDADGDRASAPFTARLSGTGFTSRNVEISGGRGNARVTLPTAARLYTLTVSATGYEDGETPVRIAGTGQQQVADEDEEEVEEEVTVAAEPDSIEITGPSTRSGTVNEELDTPLLVRVLDDDGDGLEGARVFYRVSSGRGRLSARGNGRAIGVVTDDDGYARASFTPLDGGTITVRANTDDLSATVTFTITTGSAPTTTRGPGTGVASSTSVNPVVHVAAASRPPMLWVDGGAIYALVGASPQRFAASVDNALNITVGGGKVYWTEKTGESGGTINSANLNGSGVTELASIFATPMGIAVDVTNSKLYWTNSAGRIQSANLDGSRITNVIPGGLETPMDLALAGGNAYWTQGGNVRFVNLRGTKQIRNISTGTDTAGSLAIGGGKVYWTETTGGSGGTVNSANLNGTGATQLASILAAPIGIAVDGSRSKLYWSNARGRIQSANLDGSKIQNVVSGLGSPSELVLSNSIATPTAAATTTTTTTASNAKYDVNSDGSVDNTDAGLVADAMGTSNARYDVNGDGTVNFLDLLLVFDNRDPGAAGAPTVVGMKLSAAQIDIIEEQIDLLIATNDRSPSAMRVLVYLQQLLVTARPEKTQLLANYPNPFNPETWIPYELATDTNVRLTIYNTQGVVIRSLQFGHQSAGYYTGRDRAAYWDGRNALGEQVASGLYFYQLETDEMSLMRKMVILK